MKVLVKALVAALFLLSVCINLIACSGIPNSQSIQAALQSLPGGSAVANAMQQQELANQKQNNTQQATYEKIASATDNQTRLNNNIGAFGLRMGVTSAPI